MVGIFDCGGVLGKYEIRLKERKVVNMEALNTYKTEKTLAEQMNERLAEMKMTKAEAALKMNYSRAALSQYLNGKYASDPTELEKKVREFLAATGGVAEGQEPENSVPTGAGTLKKKVEFFESRDFVQTIGVCQACQEYMGLGIIVGKSGQGKTHALKKYAELPRVAYIECDDTMACRDLVEAIENGIGLPKGYGGTIWSRVNRIREFFNTNEGFLLIIDEADKLINKYTQKKMEILRGIFDQSNVGIVIAGEPRLETELKGNLARFANRMDFYYKLKGLSKNEVVDYLEGYEVDEEGAEEEDLEDLRDRCMSSWAELATRTIEEKLRNAAKAVPGVLDARIDAQHPRGQGTVDVIVTGAAGEASPELIRKVGEAIEPLKGNYEDYLVKSSEVVRQDFELVIYLAEDAATDGVDAQATKLIEDMMALTRGEMNTLYRDSIIQVLSTKIDNYRKTDILQPSDDMVLEQDKVIMAGDINVTVRNVVQSARGKE